MAHRNKQHSRIHLEVAGNRSGNDRHLTYQQEIADRLAGKHSRTNDASENGKDSNVDRYDENGKSKNSKGRLGDVVLSPVDTGFGSTEIYDALYPTEKLETSSSSSSLSSSEDLFQVDTKKVLKSKLSTEVTQQTENHDKVDNLEKESDEHRKLSSPTSFEFRHGSFMLPTESPPIQTINTSRGPGRSGSPPSIFINRSNSILDWSVASNDSLFSINVGNHSFNRDDLMMRRSEEITKPAELIVCVPSPLNDKKENCEKAKVAPKIEKTETKEVQSEKKEASSKVTWNSSDDSDESGGNAESFPFPVNKKPTSRSCFNCGWGFCYCSCFSCFSCCTSCSWPSGYCCKVSCSCCKIWSCSCQRWCCCSPKCLTKGDDKSVSSPDAEKEQVKANLAKETEKSSSKSWFSCFSFTPILSCLSCSPCQTCFSSLSCPSSKSCFSCFSCSFLQSCFSCFSPCKCFSCSGCHFPSCQCFSCSGCYFPSCKCFSCSGCCTLPSCRCFSFSGCCSLPSCRCFSGLQCHFPSCKCLSFLC